MWMKSSGSSWSAWGSGSTQSLTVGQQGEQRNALTCAFEPEVGFEPTTFRLRVEEPLSSRCRPDPFWLLTSAGSSSRCVPDLPCYGGGMTGRMTGLPTAGPTRP
jgi:hypothetical protein